jgi:hypothetical protein
MSDEPKPIAGWYPDKEMRNTLRLWDGEHWTQQMVPTPPEAKPVGVLAIAQGVSLGMIVATAALYFIAQFLFAITGADDTLECQTKSADRVLADLSPLDCAES